MTTATKTRSRVKPARHVNIGTACNGVFALHMTIGTGEKAKHFGYYVRRVPADFGIGFHVEKFGTEQVDGEDAEYAVSIDLQRGYHSCTCKGNTYCGHCKHVESILALIKSGKIDVPTAPKPEAKPEAKRAADCCGCCGQRIGSCDCWDNP